MFRRARAVLWHFTEGHANRAGQLMLAALFAIVLLPVRAHVAQAGPFETCVVGAPTSTPALDNPAVVAQAFNLGPDFSPAVRPFYNYAVVRVYIYNNGTTPFSYSPNDFILKDDLHGSVYQPDPTDTDIAATRLQAGIIAPHHIAAGDIAYIVFADYDIAASYSLHWSHTPTPVPFDCI
jgi:hypothetical protein